MASLNQIFFGPPGTGKTYATVEAALQILDLSFLDAHRTDRAALKRRFDELVNVGDVRFVTFHQSFSYEDFVEGLRAESGKDGQLRYEVVSGVFKSLCESADGGYRAFKVGDRFGTGYTVIDASVDAVELEKPQGKHLAIGMSMLNALATYVRDEKLTIEDLGNSAWDKKVPNSTLDPFLVNGYKNFLPFMVKHMVGQSESGLFEPSPSQKKPAKVLIIDEINRGNISRIFGELITLIEPSKRAGAAEALEVMLPYSKKRFSVPDNVYLVGTMNTADRSLAALDIALRRRFTFIEVPPQPELLAGVSVEGIDIAQLLHIMNERIAVLLDRDHCLGHAYFMPLKEDNSLERLELIFREQVLPLLQEYFFEDWQRIQWVLNDQRKSAENRFLQQPSQDLAQLFGDQVAISQQNERWLLNPEAFTRAEAYLGVIDHLAEPPTLNAKEEVQHDGLTIRRLASGTIEVLRDGERLSPSIPILRDIAKKHNVALDYTSGLELNSRALGARVIKALSSLAG